MCWRSSLPWHSWTRSRLVMHPSIPALMDGGWRSLAHATRASIPVNKTALTGAYASCTVFTMDDPVLRVLFATAILGERTVSAVARGGHAHRQVTAAADSVRIPIDGRQAPRLAGVRADRFPPLDRFTMVGASRARTVTRKQRHVAATGRLRPPLCGSKPSTVLPSVIGQGVSALSGRLDRVPPAQRPTWHPLAGPDGLVRPRVTRSVRAETMHSRQGCFAGLSSAGGTEGSSHTNRSVTSASEYRSIP